MKKIFPLVLTFVACVSFPLFGGGSSVIRAATSPSIPKPMSENCHPDYPTITDQADTNQKSDLTSTSVVWLENEDSQHEIDSFWATISDEKIDAIGSYIDHSNNTMVLTVDAKNTDTEEIQALASAALKTIHWRIEIRCRSLENLESINRSIYSTLETFGREVSGVASHIQEEDSSIAIFVAKNNVNTFLKMFPQLENLPIEIIATEEAGGYAVRCGDTPAHFGGAAFGGTSDSTCAVRCTSGFKVRRVADNAIGMSTAGHCRVIPVNPVWSGNLYSGNSYFGQFSSWSFGGYSDWGFITGSTYSPKFYTDPCCPTTRTSTGASSAFVNDVLCISGSITTARCSMKVISLTGQTCGDICVGNQIVLQRMDGTSACTYGDSGGPMFSNMSNKVYGVISATFNSGSICHINPVSRMISAGFQVMTS